jgi:hypothetical protein
MHKLLKVILPPLVAFAVFLVVVKLNMADHALGLSNISDGNIYSLMAYFKLFAALPLVVALLTQLLIIVPLWNGLLLKPFVAFVLAFIIIALICVVFASGLSYIIWDQSQGKGPFIKFIVYFTFVQVAYWAIIFLILYLLDIKAIYKAKTTELHG